MKPVLFMLSALAAASSFGTPARAQNYPWCADYGGGFGGSSNCGFPTYEQCMTTLSGMGGFCERNTQYVPGASLPPSASRGRTTKRS